MWLLVHDIHAKIWLCFPLLIACCFAYFVESYPPELAPTFSILWWKGICKNKTDLTCQWKRIPLSYYLTWKLDFHTDPPDREKNQDTKEGNKAKYTKNEIKTRNIQVRLAIIGVKALIGLVFITMYFKNHSSKVFSSFL